MPEKNRDKFCLGLWSIHPRGLDLVVGCCGALLHGEAISKDSFVLNVK